MTDCCLDEDLARALLADEVPLTPLTPEASARRYFRPIQEKARGWLLVRSADPPPRAATDWLRECGVRVPRLGASMDGAYLVEDLGDRHLAHAPRPAAYDSLLEAGERLGRRPLPAGHPNARLALDAELFRRELRLFREAYVQAFRKRAHSPSRADEIDKVCGRLACGAAEGPWRVQHRDFHSRNVLLPEAGGIALIDHQDLRRGPVFYDLASLWTDAYVDPPAEVRARLAAEVPELGAREGLSGEEAAWRFRLTALQRVLKALGTFGRLLVLGRAEYAPAEERARGKALALLCEFPEYHGLGQWIA